MFETLLYMKYRLKCAFIASICTYKNQTHVSFMSHSKAYLIDIQLDRVLQKAHTSETKESHLSETIENLYITDNQIVVKLSET